MKSIALLLCAACAAAPTTARCQPAKAASGADPAASEAAPPHLPAVDLNSADAATLRTLEGINAARAQAIIAGRPYENIDALVGQMILPQAVFQKIKGRLTVKAAPAKAAPAKPN